MRIAVYPGSFDPVTKGHVDIIKRAAKLFDKVIVAVALNLNKSPVFSFEERCELIRKSIDGVVDNVEIDAFQGLLVDYVKQQNAQVIVKGLRFVSDFEYEFQMALTNRKLSDDIETIFLMTSYEYSYLSSSVLKEVASLGGSVVDMLPEPIHDEVVERLLGLRVLSK